MGTWVHGATLSFWNEEMDAYSYIPLRKWANWNIASGWSSILNCYVPRQKTPVKISSQKSGQILAKKIWSKLWWTPGVAMSRIKQEWAPTLTLTRSLSFHSYLLLIHTDPSVTYTLLIHSYSTSFYCIDSMFILITITIRISSKRSISLLTRLTLGQAKTSAAPQREVWQDKSRSDT